MWQYSFDVYRIANVYIQFNPDHHPTPWSAVCLYHHPILGKEYFDLGLFETYGEAHQATGLVGIRQAVERREEERLKHFDRGGNPLPDDPQGSTIVTKGNTDA